MNIIEKNWNDFGMKDMENYAAIEIDGDRQVVVCYLKGAFNYR